MCEVCAVVVCGLIVQAGSQSHWWRAMEPEDTFYLTVGVGLRYCNFSVSFECCARE